MKTTTKRIHPGNYLYTVNGRTFRIVELSHDAGQNSPLWNVCEVIDGRDGEFFDAAETLREAKHWAEVAAYPEGKPLIEIL